MTRSVALVGPASPRDAVPLLDRNHAAEAEEIAGYRGVPVTELAAALIAADYEVDLITVAPDVHTKRVFHGRNLRMMVGPMRPRARDRARDFFRAERAQIAEMLAASSAPIVHANWTYEFALAALADPRPALVTAHDAPMTVLWNYRDAYRLVRAAMAWATRRKLGELVVVSPYLEDAWRREMLFRGPIHVIPNIAPRLPVNVSYSGARRAIVSVGDSSSLKNIASLLRAFRLVRKECSDVTLELVGPGLGAEDALRAWAAKHDLVDNVTFHGRLERSQLERVMDRARVLAHPSLEECHPIAVIEAMAAGVPVVAGENSGGVPWTLDDGRAGSLVDVRDPRAMAQGLLQVLKNPALQEALASKAMDRVQSMYSPEVVADHYTQLYRALQGS